MLQITVFMNGATRRYQTDSFKGKYRNLSDMEAYNEAISNIDYGNTKVITFKDVFSNVNVSVSPITCLIECEEVVEDGISTNASPGSRNKPDGLKHGRHCLRWLRENDAMSMSDLTSINTILSGDMF